MIKIALKKFLSWKNMLVLLFVLIILYFSFFFLNISNFYFPQTALDTDTFFNGYGVLPIVFVQNELLLNSLLTEMLYFLLFIFPIAGILKYYLEESIASSMVRIGRKKWFIRTVFLSIAYMMFATLCYIICEYIYYGNVWENISFIKILIPLMMKVGIAAVVAYLFIYLIIKFSSGVIAISGSCGMGILIHLLFRFNVASNGYLYQASLILNICVILLIIFLCLLGIKEIMAKDL